MMKKKVKITAAISAATISLLIIPHYNQPQQEPPIPDTSPISVSVELYRGNTPSTENKAVVANESPEISTRNPLPNDSLIEIDFEPPKPNDRPAILIPKEPPRDNPTPELSPPQTTATVTATEPKMGDTQIVDGQKQLYFLGFGWIEDNDEPNECIVVDGDGDINKMVGTMD